MTKDFDYHQRMDVKFAHGELIDVDKMVAECTETWFNHY